jgi:ribosomal protein L37E
MENSSLNDPEIMICLRCGESNDFTASRCTECGAPLDDFASSSPWEMATVKSASYLTPVDPRTKPIIFWGVWLYFGPSAFGSLWIIGTTLYPIIRGDDSANTIVGGIAIILLASLYGVASIWALWSVSTRYFKKDRTVHPNG